MPGLAGHCEIRVLARTRHDTVRVRVHFEDVLKAAARTSQ